MDFFCTSTFFALPPPGLFSCSRLRGTQGARVNTAVQVWALAEVRGTCSWGSKSRKVASIHWIRFRPPRANQAHGTPKHFFEFLGPDPFGVFFLCSFFRGGTCPNQKTLAPGYARFPLYCHKLGHFFRAFHAFFVSCAHKSEICEQVTPIFHRYHCKTLVPAPHLKFCC